MLLSRCTASTTINGRVGVLQSLDDNAALMQQMDELGMQLQDSSHRPKRQKLSYSNQRSGDTSDYDDDDSLYPKPRPGMMRTTTGCRINIDNTTVDHRSTTTNKYEPCSTNSNGAGMPLSPTEFIDILDRFTSIQTKKCKKIMDSRRMMTINESVGRPSQTKICEGDLRLARLLRFLNQMHDGSESWTGRSPDQINFHDNFVNASLPRIYGAEWNEQSARVMAERGITEINTEVMIMTPRRFGKTYAIAMYVLGIMLAVPGTIVNVYSPGSRASTSLMKLVAKFYASLHDEQGRMCWQNKCTFLPSTSVVAHNQRQPRWHKRCRLPLN